VLHQRALDQFQPLWTFFYFIMILYFMMTANLPSFILALDGNVQGAKGGQAMPYVMGLQPHD
jgi:hypothetical protein